jgi:hypothetical protein
VKIKRIYHHYSKWEEVKAGLWDSISDSEAEYNKLQECIQFIDNTDLYGEFMLKAIKMWPFSCEQNLSNLGCNRQAWIGHAAACIAINSPEYITRQAWWVISEDKRILANKKADQAIKTWETYYAEKEIRDQHVRSSEAANIVHI